MTIAERPSVMASAPFLTGSTRNSRRAARSAAIPPDELAAGRPGPESLGRHRADCDHIDPDWPARFVTGDRLKACSTHPAALAIWAKPRSEPLTYCLGCYHRWLDEQTSHQS